VRTGGGEDGALAGIKQRTIFEQSDGLRNRVERACSLGEQFLAGAHNGMQRFQVVSLLFGCHLGAGNGPCSPMDGDNRIGLVHECSLSFALIFSQLLLACARTKRVPQVRELLAYVREVFSLGQSKFKKDVMATGAKRSGATLSPRQQKQKEDSTSLTMTDTGTRF
jgi:hypothetical protein